MSVLYHQRCLQAQRDYCDTNEVPHFAPFDGVCFSCGLDIYGPGGITLDEAGSQLVTGCPYCLRTYCD